ncbi:FAD/NAD(P)-binding domain-containing protein [Cadophora sp. DSE1049]|nr:FAD/NAD(P)-binding domain-containing protein [Cadophora sp. DSE1049]
MSSKAPTKFNVLIIGGGIAGFACAVGLRRKGHEVTVLERSANLQTFGGSLLISSNALRVIEDYGLLKNFHEVAEPWATHTVIRHDGKVLDVLSNKANEKVFGYEMLTVRRQIYQKVLYEAAVREGVKVRFGCRVETIDEEKPSVKLTSGETVEADLIVGADGIKSIVRPAVLGGKDIQLEPNSTCYQCTIPGSVMESNPLTAPLAAELGIQSWWGPNSHWICGRKLGGQSYDAGFFIHPTKDRPLWAFDGVDASSSNSQNSDRKGDINDILSNISAYEPRVKEFAKMITADECRLWKVAALPDLATWVSQSGKIALLGDAAHAMSPHLGQGAAMSIEDGGLLAECLGRAESVDDIPISLHAYEKIQKPRAEKIKLEAHKSGDFKTLTEGPEQRKRDEGFAKRLESGPNYEFWRASGHLKWIYAWNYKEEAKKELDKVFPTERKPSDRARI